MKKCTKCGIEKEFSEFNKHTKSSDGLRLWCRSCGAAYQKKYRNNHPEYRGNGYREWTWKNAGINLTVDEYNLMLIKQDFCCLICKQPHLETISRGRLYVDHCHITGKVCGLLCHKCNCGLGMFNDNLLLIEIAANYLKQTRV